MFSGCPSICACVRACCGEGILQPACCRLLASHCCKWLLLFVLNINNN